MLDENGRSHLIPVTDITTVEGVREAAEEAAKRRRDMFRPIPEPRHVFVQIKPPESVIELRRFVIKYPFPIGPQWMQVERYMPLKLSRPYPTLKQCAEWAAKHCDVSVQEMKSHRRTRCLTWPRNIYVKLAKEFTLNSYPKIGLHMGGRDHTTVLHAYKTFDKKREENEPDFQLPIGKWWNSNA